MHVPTHVGHREPGLAGSGPPLLSIHPRCSVWLRVGEGRVHSGKGALTVGHRVLSRPQEWEAGPATVRRPCRNLTGWGGGVDNTGSPEEVASGYSIRKWPRGGAVHTCSHSIPGAGSHIGTGVRAPFCRRRN